MNKFKAFVLSEEGGIVEWLVGAVIIGAGTIPIVLGIAGAINAVGSNGENTIRDMIWTGY